MLVKTVPARNICGEKSRLREIVLKFIERLRSEKLELLRLEDRIENNVRHDRHRRVKLVRRDAHSYRRRIPTRARAYRTTKELHFLGDLFGSSGLGSFGHQ